MPSPAALRPWALASLLLAQAATAQAQTAAPPQQVTVTGSRSAQQPLDVAGFGDTPLSRLPLSATVITVQQLQDAGIAGLGDLTRLDAGATEAYNMAGYIGQLAVRGFTLDNRFNLRRDGLPISGETALPLGNKQALELLKGSSGLQAGTSAPGGLVNLAVKRPTGALAEVSIAWEQPGAWRTAADLGDRQPVGQAGTSLGWRLNLGAERLDSPVRHSRGQRWLAALAADLQWAHGRSLEAEVEFSRQRQPSVPGFSLWGADDAAMRLPAASATDPRINLNHQAWTLPVVFSGRTASLRHTEPLAGGWSLVAHAMRQRLDTDDRVAFPFGCSAENLGSSFCSDGRFDVYDYRSEGEQRTSDALQLSAAGPLQAGGWSHRLSLGVLATRHRADFQRQAYNWVGMGNVSGDFSLPADPTLTDENTLRRERSRELHLRDALALDATTTLYAGLRATELERQSVRTDGSRATDYRQSFTTPWLALAHQWRPATLLYASWGRGVESEVAPNRNRYVNAGEALPALQSRQLELGLKHRGQGWHATAALFDLRRPMWEDVHAGSGRVAQGDCRVDDPCRRQHDGSAHHRGLELEADGRLGAFNLRTSAMLLQARREASRDAARNGLRPTNVPARSLKAQLAYNVGAVPGLALLAFASHESGRMVTPDNQVSTNGWTRLDAAVRLTQRLAAARWSWRLGVDNLTDQRAWKEAPWQYEHAWLAPMPPRRWHASLNISH